MAYIYKLKPAVVRFIMSRKYSNPEISCRKLALEASKKFSIKLSKSSVNNITIKEKLSSPVGRRPKQNIGTSGEANQAGSYMLWGVDHLLGLSKTIAKVLIENIPSASKNLQRDIENVIQGLIIYKSISDVTIDISACYDNKLIWSTIGRRPTRTAYNRIIEILKYPQLFVDQLVRELGLWLAPISGFRFVLRDDSSFFVDAGLNSISPAPNNRNVFTSTHYISSSYINKLISNDRVFSVFNAQRPSIFSPDILDFILAFDSQSTSKRIKQIELLDPDNSIVENKLITGFERRFFLLGFWPWQLDMMSEFERRPARQKLALGDFGLDYYYQIEDISIPQHLVAQEVKQIAIILKDSPLGPARFGILSNLSRDVISNYLSYNELYHWIAPEDRYKYFTKMSRQPELEKSLSSRIAQSKIENYNSLDGVFGLMSQIIFTQFQYRFLPQEVSVWSKSKIKEFLMKLKGEVKKSKESVIHNLLSDKELCNDANMKYICQRLNEAGIRDSEGRMLVFKLNEAQT